MANFDGTDDTFDSRDVIERIEELTAEWNDTTGDDADGYALSEDDWAAGLGEDQAAEVVALIALRDAATLLAADWADGETFIADDYFEEYARELAADIGAYDPEAGWPNAHIDWAAAADSLRMDYTEFEFRGTTYWAR